MYVLIGNDDRQIDHQIPVMLEEDRILLGGNNPSQVNNP